jgi:hypothetical protein
LSQTLAFPIHGPVEELDEELAKLVSFDDYFNGVSSDAPGEVLSTEEVSIITPPSVFQDENLPTTYSSPIFEDANKSTTSTAIESDDETENYLVSQMRVSLCGMV